MSTTIDYVTFLTRNGVRLWVDKGQLCYHAKKGVLSSEELTRLRSMKGEIIAELTREGASTTDDSAPIQVVCATEGPLSFQQRWCLGLLEAHPSWKATMSYTFHLQGALDPTILEGSLRGVLRMHASLRTRVVCDCDEWRQKIETSEGFQLPITQVSGESDSERQDNALLLIQKSAAQELDPAVDPLITTHLIRVSAREHFLVLLVHRLVTDCLGMSQALRDLWALYAGTAQKGAATSLEGPARYRDYALWQHASDRAWRQKHGAYWNDYLAGAQPVLWPPQEWGAPATGNAPGGLVSLESSFGPVLSAKLRELSQQTRTLPALVMLTLYVAGVSLWCGQRDLLMPFVVAGRAAEHEAIVGCFSYIVYLRIRLEGKETFIALLKRVSNEFYRAAAFRQDSGRMVTQRPELLRGTLCQWLSWHPADITGSPDSQGGQLGFEVETIRCQNPEQLTNVPPDRADLEMNFFDAAGEIFALAIYRPDRFAESAPARLMRGLRSVAEHAVRDPGTPIAGWPQG